RHAISVLLCWRDYQQFWPGLGFCCGKPLQAEPGQFLVSWHSLQRSQVFVFTHQRTWIGVAALKRFSECLGGLIRVVHQRRQAHLPMVHHPLLGKTIGFSLQEGQRLRIFFLLVVELLEVMYESGVIMFGQCGCFILSLVPGGTHFSKVARTRSVCRSAMTS